MSDLSNVSILVIDDFYLNRQYLKVILEDISIRVIEAGDGSEALDILEHQKPDLIILDLIMPVMNGVEALEKIRERGYNVPVLILTADMLNSTKERCLQLGVAGFIKKPVNSAEIIKHIKAAFQEK